MYRASSLGYSLEALVAPHLGFEPKAPPEFLQKAFDEGNRIEPLALEKICLHFTEGEFIDSSQREITLDIIPGQVQVVGHLDGILHYQDKPGRVVEIKSMNGQTWQRVQKLGFDAGGVMDKYAWQISAYMLGSRLGALMVFWNKDDEELGFLEVDEPFYTISDIATKLAQAEEYIEKGLVPEGCKDFPCPYYYLHAPNESEIAPADIELEALMQSWLTWDKAEKAAKKAKDEHREKMLALTGDAVAAKIKGECGVVVETYWQDEKEYMVRQSGKWVTRVSGPRKNAK